MKKQGRFYILCDTSENFTFVQLMYSVSNVNNEVSIVSYCTFESNYKKELPLTLDALNLLCYLSEGEVMFTLFETVFHAVGYIKNTGKLKIHDQ